jgi:hypothetical protein
MRGFTLIESIIYIALLAFIMTSVLTCVYLLMQGGSTLDAKTSVQDEGNFVMRKLDWVFGSMNAIATPSSGYLECGSGSPGPTCLSFTQYDGTIVQIRLNTSPTGKTDIEMRETGNLWTAISTDNVTVSDLAFMKISGSPAGIEASTTINGVTFTTRKYLRQ